MTPGRLEAFSDGVIAIIITIMVLEFKMPAGVEFKDLAAIQWSLLCYVLSFVMVGIYWNNHHHMIRSVEKVDGGVLWANMHLLFWLSLTPFVTKWMGNPDKPFAPAPVVTYGFVLLCNGVAYYILTLTLIRVNGRESRVAKALGADFKGKISIAVYVVALPLALLSQYISLALYVAVALMWLVPDRRFEHERKA